MFTEEYLEPSWTSAMELFFTLVKPYINNILNLIELPLNCIFYTTHSFVKKVTTVKTLEKKLTIEQIFFSKFEILQWNAIINKENF